MRSPYRSGHIYKCHVFMNFVIQLFITLDLVYNDHIDIYKLWKRVCAYFHGLSLINEPKQFLINPLLDDITEYYAFVSRVGKGVMPFTITLPLQFILV